MNRKKKLKLIFKAVVLATGQELRDLRETAARVKDFFKIILKPAPAYLGETIPVSGNGDVTND